MDEAVARELIRDHFASGGRDEVRASRIYAEPWEPPAWRAEWVEPITTPAE
jgi:hypothetical protein